MAVKTKSKAKPVKAAKKAVKKPAKKTIKKAAARPSKPALTCQVCGYRVIVDEACGCVEEHVLLCCDRPMQKA
jgi:hypothetical protein